MKKKENKNKESCCDCGEIGEVFNKIGDKMKAATKNAKKYAEKNPKETKVIAAGIGAFLLAIVAFLIGKKKK